MKRLLTMLIVVAAVAGAVYAWRSGCCGGLRDRWMGEQVGGCCCDDDGDVTAV